MRSLFALAGLLLLSWSAVACSAHDEAVTGEEDELTSLTARSRTLRFEGVVYVDPQAADSTILETVRKQTQTAFGALLGQDISVKSRELSKVDPGTFKRREVKVFDTNNANDRGRTRLEVKYVYKDSALVPVKLSRRTSLPLAVLGTAFDTDANRKVIVEACTKNDKEAREDADGGLLWYDFNPSKASCKKAITDEQARIEADAAKLEDPRTQVPQSQLDRLYIPVTMSLGSDRTEQGATYPEYDKLFTRGVSPGKLTIGMVAGRLDHKHVEAYKDDGYYEWLDMLGTLFEKHPTMKLVKIEPEENLTIATVGGRRIDGLKFTDFIQWMVYDTGYPSGLTSAEKTELKLKIGQKLDNHWLTFQMPVTVTVGGAAPNDMIVELNTTFGAEEDPAPHKRAIKTSDVFIYNGHSYIGYGPLDPSNFRASDFPSSYQLFFIDGCVSYNYYNDGYFALKPGGTKTLDTITNGIEAPEYQSGLADGLFISKLIDGSIPSYQSLLLAAKATDPMRAADGEVDNGYHPTRTPIKIVKR
jgi:hypothetical protein